MGLEVVGYMLTEGDWVGVARSVGVDLNHGFAIGCDDLGDHAPLSGVVRWRHAVGTDRKGAASAEGIECGAFGIDGESGVRVFEEGDGVADVGVARLVDWVCGAPRFQAERALPWRGAHFGGTEALVDPLGTLEAVEASRGEHESIALSGGEFFETSVDVASDFYEGNVRTKSENLRAAARAGGADATAGGKGVERPVGLADPDVAGVGALRDSGEGKLRGKLGWKVFERVHGEIDAAFFEGFLDLFDEDPFAVEVWGGDEAGLLHAVTGGADDLELDVIARVSQGVEDVIGLPES